MSKFYYIYETLTVYVSTTYMDCFGGSAIRAKYHVILGFYDIIMKYKVIFNKHAFTIYNYMSLCDLPETAAGISFTFCV